VSEEKKQIATLHQRQAFALVPTTMDEAMKLSEYLAKSELVPSSYRGKAPSVFVAIQMGLEIGLTPTQALQTIAVINGRPSLYGDGILAVVQAHPAYEWHKETHGEDYAECTVKRVGSEPYTVRWTAQMAEQAGLTKKSGPWHDYPLRMLQMRARSWAMRDQFADALKGLGAAEEIEDVTPVDNEIQMPKPLPEPEAPKAEPVVEVSKIEGPGPIPAPAEPAAVEMKSTEVAFARVAPENLPNGKIRYNLIAKEGGIYFTLIRDVAVAVHNASKQGQSVVIEMDEDGAVISAQNVISVP